MLSLSRAVVSGVARAPAAISQGGVTVFTRFNSTAQVPDLYFVKTKMLNVSNNVNILCVCLVFPECSQENNIWTSGR